MKPLYEIYDGKDLYIAEKIQQRRLQMLVHSYLYYELDRNLVSDAVWSRWAVELANLQKKYPEIEKQVPYREGFEEWDGSSGAFLPYNNEQVRTIADRLLHISRTPNKKSKALDKNPARKKLF